MITGCRRSLAYTMLPAMSDTLAERTRYSRMQQLTVLGSPLGEQQVLVRGRELVEVANDWKRRRPRRHTEAVATSEKDSTK